MFKKGEFIRHKGCSNSVVYKVIKITKDLGGNRIYVLRPKGCRNDGYDDDYDVSYVNKEFEKYKKTSSVTIQEALKLIVNGKFDTLVKTVR